VALHQPLQQASRAEKWRQTLTLQNQELARRLLELEARREQIEALEESFKRDKESWGAEGAEENQAWLRLSFSICFLLSLAIKKA